MKKFFVLVLVMAFAASSVCFAAEAAKKSEAKDPVTATVEVAGEIVTAPVEAVFGPSNEAKPEAKDPVTATVQAAGEVVAAPVKAVTGQNETKK